MDNEVQLIKKILTGDFQDDVPELSPSLVRIFLSSTFSGKFLFDDYPLTIKVILNVIHHDI